MKVSLSYKHLPGEHDQDTHTPKRFRTSGGGLDFDAVAKQRMTLLSAWDDTYSADKNFAHVYYDPDNGLLVTSKYDPNLVADIKRIPGARFSRSEFVATANGVKGLENVWTVPEEQAGKLVGVLNRHVMRPNAENLKRAQELQDAQKATEQKRRAAEQAQRGRDYRAAASKTPATDSQVSYIQRLLTNYTNADGSTPTIQEFGDISKLRASEIIDMLKSDDLASSFGLFPSGGGSMSEIYGGDA